MEQAVLEQVEVLIRIGRTVDQAAAQLQRAGIDQSLIERAIEFRRELAKVQREQTFEGGALLDPELVGAPWYTGTSENDVFWPKLERTLRSDPSWSPAVGSIDVASHDIVGLLQDPHSPAIKTRGLVIGHVQSGKTA